VNNKGVGRAGGGGGGNSMLQIKGQKWNTTQHSTLVKSVKKNVVWFTGMMIVMVTKMMMIDNFIKL